MTKNGSRPGKGAADSVGSSSSTAAEFNRRAGITQLVTRRRTTSRKTVEHFLLSFALDCSANMHCYLMSDDRRYLQAAADRMLTEAEKLGCYPLNGMMLATPITADVALVREIISKRNAEAEHLFRTATDFHWSVFVTCADDPDDARLLALH
jgi:hypothetical protein